MGVSEAASVVVHTKSWRTFFMELAIASIPMMAALWATRQYLNLNKPDPDSNKNRALKLKGRSIKTTSYENTIINDVTLAKDIDVAFADVGGNAELKEELYETMILPLLKPELFHSASKEGSQGGHCLLGVPRGVLFYGPPGTGKTMMAKAIAKECGSTFINLRLSTLQSKWFGETNKLVAAMFSLAHKLAPAIIFIDEVDLFLSTREKGGHGSAASGAMQAEFMTLWDGLMTNESSRITVLGATNRPGSIDKAILRRLPRTYLFALPDVTEREAIIRVILKNHIVCDDFDYYAVAQDTEGYSGSDLKELAKFAAMLPIREVLESRRQAQRDGRNAEGDKPRPLQRSDIVKALTRVKATGQVGAEYNDSSDQFRDMMRSVLAAAAAQRHKAEESE